MNEISEMARKLKNEYQKNWKRQNPDKVRASQNRYWERQAAKVENGSSLDRAIQNSVTDSVTLTNSVSDSVTCCNCGNSFNPLRKTARFCSDVCRVQFNRRNK